MQWLFNKAIKPPGLKNFVSPGMLKSTNSIEMVYIYFAVINGVHDRNKTRGFIFTYPINIFGQSALLGRGQTGRPDNSVYK